MIALICISKTACIVIRLVERQRKTTKEQNIFFNYFTLSFFSILFLPTTFTHTHTYDQRPLPTSQNPRHLATLSMKCALIEMF